LQWGYWRENLGNLKSALTYGPTFLAFSPHNGTLAFGFEDAAQDSSIVAWDTSGIDPATLWSVLPHFVSEECECEMEDDDYEKEFKPECPVRSHYPRVSAISPDGHMLSTVGMDKTRLCDLLTGAPLAILPGVYVRAFGIDCYQVNLLMKNEVALAFCMVVHPRLGSNSAACDMTSELVSVCFSLWRDCACACVCAFSRPITHSLAGWLSGALAFLSRFLSS